MLAPLSAPAPLPPTAYRLLALIKMALEGAAREVLSLSIPTPGAFPVGRLAPMVATAEARGPCKRLERSPEIGMALVAAPAAALFFFPVRQLRPRCAPAQ